jgi:hypothetical protein
MQAKRIKEMFLLFQKTVKLYEERKYIDCVLNCETITYTLDDIYLGSIQNIGLQNRYRQIRRKLLQEIDSLYEICCLKLQ